jgi:hypothetical protein
MKQQRSCSKWLPSFAMQDCTLQCDVSKKAELNSEYLCFHKFPERRFEPAAKLQTEKLPGDFQDAEYLFVAGFQFCQGRAYQFRNARNRVYKESCIGKYPLIP